MVSFIKCCYQYIEYLKVIKNASQHTIRNYTIDLNSLKTYVEIHEITSENIKFPSKISFEDSYDNRWKELDHIIPIDIISKNVIKGFITYLYNKNISKKSISRRLSSLKSFFRYLLSNSIVNKSPLDGIESPKIEKRLPKYVNDEEIEKLFAQPNIQNYLGFRDRCIMELFYSSGLRVGELVALNKNDLYFSELKMRIKGKGNKERIVPITKNAAEWVKDYLNHGDRYKKTSVNVPENDENAVFLNKYGKRISERSIDRKFYHYLSKSGLSGSITPHTLRHAIATHLLENNMDIKTLQEILGHKNLSTTTIYAKVSNKLKKEVYDKAHPRAK